MAEDEPIAESSAALIRLSAALATRQPAEIRSALEQAARDAAPEAVDEVILQSHLFIGFPDTLNALVLWRELGAPRPAALPPEPAELWERRGAELCARVYGANYAKLRANVAALHPDLDRWMVTGGYGRVLGRPGLDLVTRELCIAALLAVWGAPRQLHSHLRGALNAGATPVQVDRAVEIAARLLDPGGAAGVKSLWDEVRRAAPRADGSG